MAEQSFTTMAGPKAEGDAPEIGIGMLGYAFMGKAHTNAYKKIPYMMYPPPAIPAPGRDLRAQRGGRAGGGAALRLRRLLHRLARDAGRPGRSSSSTTAARTTCTPSRPSPPPRRASTSSARSRWRATPKRPRPCSTRSTRPASSTWSPSTTASCRPSAWRDNLIESGAAGPHLPLPRRLPAGMDHAALRHGHDLAARQEAGRQRRAGRPGRAHHRPGALPGRRDQERQRHDHDLHRRAPAADGKAWARWTWTTPSSPPWSSRTARSARWRPRASPPAARTTTACEINGEKGTIRFNLERMNELEVFWVGEEPEGDAGLPQRARHRRLPPLDRQLVAAGHIIGWEHTFVHEIAPLPRLHRERQGRGALRRDLRGRLPQRGGLRRDRRIGRRAPAG